MPFQPGAVLSVQSWGLRAENLEVPWLDVRAPLTTDVNFPLGKTWLDTVAANYYVLGSKSSLGGTLTANWAFLGGTSGDLNTITTDDATVVHPTSGNIAFTGTTNQLVTSGSNGPGTMTVALSSTIVTPGSLTTTTTLIAGTSFSTGTSAVIGTTLTATGGLTTLAALTQTGTASINASGSGVTTIGTGGTGAVNIGNATGNTAVTGSLSTTTTLSAGTSFSTGTSAVIGTTLTATGGLTTLAALTQTGTASLNASGSGVTTIGTGGTGAVNIGNATGNTAVTGSLTTSTTLTATSGAITATSGNFVASAAGTGLLFPPTVVSGAASGTVNCNGRVGSITFTGVSIAAAADLTLTMGNTSVGGAATRLNWCMSGATTGSALSVKSYTPSSNQVVWVVTNGTGATTSTANITFDFFVVN